MFRHRTKSIVLAIALPALLCGVSLSFSPALAMSEAGNELFEKGCDLMVKKQFSAAIGSFTESLSRRPNDANCYFRRGQCFYCLQDFQKSILDFERAIALDGNNAQFFVWRGTAYSRINNDDKAIHDFERAMRIDPGLIEAYRQAQEAKKASSGWDNPVKSPSKKSAETINLGTSEHAVKDYEEAFNRTTSNLSGYFRPGAVYSGVCGLDGKLLKIPGLSDDADLWQTETRHGEPYTSLKNAGKDMRDFDQQINDRPNVASLYFARGRAFQQLGHKQEALNDFNRAIDLDKDNANYLLARAYLYHQQEKTELAKIDIRQAQDLEPAIPVLLKFEPPRQSQEAPAHDS
ncbi:MAG TPA: tetratricopeptide repeat protein [Chroococcales cyanobacterium]